MPLRHSAAWITFPLLMGGFVRLAAFGLARGYDPGLRGIVLAVTNFFVILGIEQRLPHNPDRSVFGDPRSLSDIAREAADTP